MALTCGEHEWRSVAGENRKGTFAVSVGGGIDRQRRGGLHGAPVTTVDVDFMFRKTPANLRKLKKFGALMNCMMLQPYYGSSGLYRAVNEDEGIQVDFMSVVHGVRAYSSLKSRAKAVTFGRSELPVASLTDVIASKRAANRPRDRAVLEILERTLREAKKAKTA